MRRQTGWAGMLVVLCVTPSWAQVSASGPGQSSSASGAAAAPAPAAPASAAAAPEPAHGPSAADGGPGPERPADAQPVSNKPSGVRAETVRKVLAARSNVADHKAAGHQMELQERQEAEELLVKLGKARAALEAERQRLEKVLAAAHAAPKGGPCKEPAESKAAPADDTASAEKSAPPTRKKAPALDIRAVAKQVQAMSPKKAALVLDHMDRATAAQVLRTMGARQAGAVLAALNPNTAAELLQTRPPAEDR